MAKKSRKRTPFERKMETILKLKSIGVTTEKDLAAVSLERMLRVENVTIDDLRELLEVQRQVKERTLFSWLCAEEPAEIPIEEAPLIPSEALEEDKEL